MSGHLDLRFLVGPRARRWGAVLASLLAVLGLLVLVLPSALRGFVERAIGEELHRPVSIASLGFNPLTLNVSVQGLKISSLGKEPPLLELGSVRAKISPSSLWHKAIIISALKIERPRLYVARLEDSRYNFSDIIDRLRAKPSSGAATRFALYNLELRDGAIRFDDRPLGQSHKVDQLRLGLPLLSSIPADITVIVKPELVARVDGSVFALSGRVRPFLAVPEATLDLDLASFDLVPLLAYLPFKPAITVAQGRMATHLKLRWHQVPRRPAALSLSGRIEALDWNVLGQDGKPLAGFDRLAVDVAVLDLTARHVAIKSVDLDKLDLEVLRNAQGRIRLLDDIKATLDGGAGKPAAASTPASARVQSPADKPWTWQLGELRLAGAHLKLADETVSPAFAASLAPVDVLLDGLGADLSKPAALKLTLAGDKGETVSAEGHFTIKPLAWKGKLELKDIQPSRAAGYLAGVVPALAIDGGRVSAHLPFELKSGADGVRFALDGARLSVDSPVLRRKADQAAFFKAEKIELSAIALDSSKQTLGLGSLKLDAPELLVRRMPRGNLDLAALLPAADQAGARKAALAPSKTSPPWHFTLGEAIVSGGALAYEDQTRKPLLKLALKSLDLLVKDFSSEGKSTSTVALKTGWNRGGQLIVLGTVSPRPLVARLRVDARHLDVVPLIAQGTEHYEVSVTRAKLDARGHLVVDLSRADTPNISYRGELGVSDFASLDLINDTDFVRWRQFSLNRVDARLNPTSLAIGDVVLNGLQTRLILDAEGKLNLREVTREQDDAAPPSAASAPVTKPAKAAVVTVSAPPKALPPVRIGRISLAGADIRYSDRFIKPNFNAKLLGLKGTLAGLTTDSNQVATLQLAGAVDGSAPLSLNGQLAPFRQDRYLDLKAAVKGYEMSALSSYSGKYVGYGIEKGQLSMDLRYRITDRKLTAENRIFLDQLTLGEKIESPSATKLPVKFALSLLKNRRGEIDIKLPISGTLDDPQFSVAGIVWKMIGNLFAKIVTAPFSFLSDGAGEAELSNVPFVAGTSRLGPDATKRLETVAKALVDRPALKLELTGRADPVVDLNGLRRESLQRKLRTEKLRQMAREGESGGSIGEITIAAREYPELLEKVYKGEKFEGKPRNLIGFAKSLPVAEMERLLLAHAAVRDADVRTLAQARAAAVKTWLLEIGKVSPEQVFLLAPKLGADPDKAGASALQVDFSLR